MTRDEDALRMLAEVEAANTDLAQRAKAPAWYHPALGLLMGGMAAIEVAPIAWHYAYFVVFGLGVWLLVKAYIRKTGLWIYGFRAGRTRLVALPLALLYGALAAISGWLYHERQVTYAPFLFGAAIAVGVTIGGLLWEAAFRADLRDGHSL